MLSTGGEWESKFLEAGNLQWRGMVVQHFPILAGQAEDVHRLCLGQRVDQSRGGIYILNTGHHGQRTIHLDKQLAGPDSHPALM